MPSIYWNFLSEINFQLVLVDDQVKIVDFDSAYFHHGNNADYDKCEFTVECNLNSSPSPHNI